MSCADNASISCADPEILYTAIGIIGATVMPHNLYLHSSIIQTRNYPRTFKVRHYILAAVHSLPAPGPAEHDLVGKGIIDSASCPQL